MKASTLRTLRTWHRYFGVFLAPAILFFSFTGFLQVTGLQDRRDPPPPAWVSYIAGIHKHQAAPRPRPAAPARKPEARASTGHDEHDHGGFVPLKVFALVTAIGLFLTTLIGLLVAFGTRTTRGMSWLMLALGVAVPGVLMLV